MSFQENQKPTSSNNKDQDNQKENTDTAAKDHLHGDPLFKSVKETWQTVPTKVQNTRHPRRGARGGRTPNNTATRGASSRSVPHQKHRNEGPEEIRGRGTRGRRGRGSGSKPGRYQGRGTAGKKVFFLPP